MNNKKLGEFDWILSFKDIKSLLQPLLTPTSRVLVIGCGNSKVNCRNCRTISDLRTTIIHSTSYRLPDDKGSMKHFNFNEFWCHVVVDIDIIKE